MVKGYIKGSGIEIGAYSAPQEVNAGVNVVYVDRCTGEQMKAFHPNRANENPVNVDVIDNGELLSKFADSSQDFIIAHHVFEHFKNPLLAMQNWTRVLKTGGVIVISIPDKRFTFDKDRDLTSWDELVSDYHNNITIQDSERDDHEHVWDQVTMLSHMSKLMDMFNFDLELAVKREIDTLFVLRRL